MDSALIKATEHSGKAIAATLSCFVVAVLVFLLMPLYVGALTDSYQLSASQVGWLTSGELFGQALACLAALFWIRRFAWRRIMQYSAALLLLTNITSSLQSHDYELLFALRFIAGFAAGSILALGCTVIGESSKADRYFGLLIAAEVFVQSICFWFLPATISDLGVDAIFYLLAGASLVATIVAPFIPRESHMPGSAKQAFSAPSGKAVSGLLATVFFFMGITCIWAFIERMGAEKSLSAESIGMALSLSALLSMGGALAAAYTGDKHGRFIPMLLGLSGMLGALWVLMVSQTMWLYLPAVTLLAIFWNLWVPFQMSTVASADAGGNVAVLIPLCQAAGVAIGPALAGLLLSGENFSVIIWTGGSLLVLSLFLFIPLTRINLPSRLLKLPS